jgi:hypothetical protein
MHKITASVPLGNPMSEPLSDVFLDDEDELSDELPNAAVSGTILKALRLRKVYAPE